jgi:hypothetical protein
MAKQEKRKAKEDRAQKVTVIMHHLRWMILLLLMAVLFISWLLKHHTLLRGKMPLCVYALANCCTGHTYPLPRKE